MTKLLIAPCSYQAAKYAVEKWHYSKGMPAFKNVSYGVWENDIFVGAIVFSRGANKNMHKPYSIQMNECCELTRVALYKHIAPVSQVVSITIKQLKLCNPGLRLIVSYADPAQGHVGKIYQAMNWLYEGTVSCTPKYLLNGKWVHARSANEVCGSVLGLESYRVPDKHKYLYPLDRAMRKQIAPLAKPYPKREYASD